jgi:hypothetical protein
VSSDPEELRRYALDPETRRNLARSERAVRAWEQENPTTLDGVLAWIDSLRGLIGEPAVDLDPWPDNDFRL